MWTKFLNYTKNHGDEIHTWLLFNMFLFKLLLDNMGLLKQPHRHVVRSYDLLKLVSTLECQVSWGDNYDEVVDHQCNLAYASK